MITLAAACCAFGCQSAQKTATLSRLPAVAETDSQRRDRPINWPTRQASHTGPNNATGFAIHAPEKLPPRNVPPVNQSTNPSVITLRELEEIALSSNPTIMQAIARIDALRGKWIQAGLWRNPTVGHVANEMGASGTVGQQGIYVGQEFVRGNKLKLSQAVVRQEIARAEQALIIQRQRVLTDVRIAYYDVLIARRKVDATSQLVRLSEEAVNASNALFEAADISRIEVLQAGVEADRARILARQAANRNHATWQRLLAVTGKSDLPRLEFAETIDSISQDIKWDEALQRIVAQSPELSMALAQVQRARRAVARANVQAIPNVSLQTSVQYSADTNEAISGLQVGLPLPLFDRNQGGIQQARSQVLQAERNVQRVELDLQQRLAGAYNRYADARFEVEKYSRDIQPKAQETISLVTKGYQEGEVNYITFLTAQRTFFQTKLGYIDSLRKLWSAIAEIDELLLKNSMADNSFQ